jgi:hypothetical protein
VLWGGAAQNVKDVIVKTNYKDQYGITRVRNETITKLDLKKARWQKPIKKVIIKGNVKRINGRIFGKWSWELPYDIESIDLSESKVWSIGRDVFNNAPKVTVFKNSPNYFSGGGSQTVKALEPLNHNGWGDDDDDALPKIVAENSSCCTIL